VGESGFIGFLEVGKGFWAFIFLISMYRERRTRVLASSSGVCSSEVTADIYLTIEGELEKNVFCKNNARACYPCRLFEQRGLGARSRGWLPEERFLTWTSVHISPCAGSVWC